MPAGAAAESITYNSKAGRWVLGVAIAGSGMAFLDSTIVSVALPAIGRISTRRRPHCSGSSTATS
jgi:hypothetical protein